MKTYRFIKLVVTIILVTIQTHLLSGQSWTFTWPNSMTCPNNVGIGFSTPTYLLDVDGVININNPLFGYHINGNELLKYHGDPIFTPSTTNIFVGLGAGTVNQANVGLLTGLENTFLGHNAGTSNTEGSYNTFIGNEAGHTNWKGRFNTFMGDSAGYNILCRYYNTLIGFKSGFNLGQTLSPGENGNTFVGYLSGLNSTIADGNAFFGNYAGAHNDTGSYNTYIGFGTQFSNLNGHLDNDYSTAVGANSWIKGDYAVAIGANTIAEGNKSTAVGAFARTTHDNTMILGDNDINVGIGLSNDNTSVSL